MARDPIEILISQAQTRTPALVPIRYGRMLRSPFAFFRGAAAIMAADLAGTPVSGMRAQLCGDATCPTSASSARPTQAGLRHQRLRRDPARAVGVGRQAPGGERRGGRTRPRLHGRERRDAVRAPPRYRKAMRELRRHAHHRRLVRAARRRRCCATGRARRWRKELDKDGPRPGARTTCGRSTSSPRRRRRAADRQRPAADRAAREILAARRRRDAGPARGAPAQLPRTLPANRRPLLDATASSTWPTRSSASAASDALPGSSCSSGATPTTRCSCRSRRRRPP